MLFILKKFYKIFYKTICILYINFKKKIKMPKEFQPRGGGSFRGGGAPRGGGGGFRGGGGRGGGRGGFGRQPVLPSGN